MIWPFFANVLTYSSMFPELQLPSSREMPLLSRWIDAMKKDPVCSEVMRDNDVHFPEHTRRVLEGTFDYNVGL